MIKVHTFLVKTSDGEERYVSLEDSLNLKEIIEHRKFTPEYIQMQIVIQCNDQIITGNDLPSGLNLWSDYVVAIEQYLNDENVEIHYGIDPYLMKLISLNNHSLQFSIAGEWEPVQVFAQAIVPKKEFLVALLDGATLFWNTLNDYKAFKGIKETTSKEYPKLMMKEIEKLREKVTIQFNN